MNRRLIRWVMAALALAVVASACDSGGGGDKASAADKQPGAEAEEEKPSNEAPGGTETSGERAPVASIEPDALECHLVPGDAEGTPEPVDCPDTMAIERAEAFCGEARGEGSCRSGVEIVVDVAACCDQFSAEDPTTLGFDISNQTSGVTCFGSTAAFVCIGMDETGAPQELQCDAGLAVDGGRLRLTVPGECFDGHFETCGDACGFQRSMVEITAPHDDPAFPEMTVRVVWQELADSADFEAEAA